MELDYTGLGYDGDDGFIVIGTHHPRTAATYLKGAVATELGLTPDELPPTNMYRPVWVPADYATARETGYTFVSESTPGAIPAIAYPYE